jgi:hypothetical protein
MAGVGAFFYKCLNFVMGKATIFIVIFAWILIVSGGLMVVWPERARKKLIRMGFQQFKFILFVIILFVVTKLLSLSDALGFQLVASGLVGIVCIYLFLKKMMYEKISLGLAKAPVLLLRGFALLQIVVGVLMFVFQKRIW